MEYLNKSKEFFLKKTDFNYDSDNNNNFFTLLNDFDNKVFL